MLEEYSVFCQLQYLFGLFLVKMTSFLAFVFKDQSICIVLKFVNKPVSECESNGIWSNAWKAYVDCFVLFLCLALNYWQIKMYPGVLFFCFF